MPLWGWKWKTTRSLEVLEWGRIEVLAQVEGGGGEKVPDWDVGIHVCTN